MMFDGLDIVIYPATSAELKLVISVCETRGYIKSEEYAYICSSSYSNYIVRYKNMQHGHILNERCLLAMGAIHRKLMYFVVYLSFFNINDDA